MKNWLGSWILWGAPWWAAGSIFAAPAVTTLSPAQGPPGTQVTVTGLGFSTASVVLFNNVPADFIPSSDTKLTAVVPDEGISGPIRVTNPTGTGASGGVFLVAPRITDFAPLRSATNLPVTINGVNFEAVTNVLFNGRTAAFAITATTQIRAIVPAGATNGPITVITPAGAATTVLDFVVTGPAPIIDDFSPEVGPPLTLVQIRGVNFTNLASVKFNGVTSPSFSAPAPTIINAQVPASATTGKISITTGGGSVTSSNNFVVTQAPVISRFTPAVGKAGSTEVTIQGVNFDSPNVITGVGIGGKPATGWGTPAPGLIRLTVPSGATNGPVRVTNTFGVGISADDFTVTQAPIVEGTDTAEGPVGAQVVIRGINFATSIPTTRVFFFNGKQANATVVADTQINAFVPAGATTGPIIVTNSFGAGTNSFNYTVTGGGPRVTALDPGRGPRGATIRIRGENFVNVTAVKFNGVNAVNVSAPAPTEINATVPATATTGPVTVTTSAGTSTNVNLFYVPPRLTSFTPTNGIVGSSVVITGANFVGVTGVLFDSAAGSFTVNASNRLTAVVPAGATTGPLTIVTPGGTIISTNNFLLVPNITGFSPAVGPAGTLVTITGTSFSGATNVSFNNVSATFSNVTSTQLTAIVPATATTGPIRVATPGGVAVSATNFVVTAASDLTLTLAASESILDPGQPLTYVIRVTNSGPAVVSGVVVSNTLPPGVTFVSASSTRGACTNIGRLVTCNLGILTNAAGATITIDIDTIAEGVLTNSAVVTAIEGDSFQGNNSATVETTVVSDLSRALRISLLSTSPFVSVSWPTSAVPFVLQSIDDLDGSNLWSLVTNPVVVAAGRNTVTNSNAGPGRFYRLLQP